MFHAYHPDQCGQPSRILTKFHSSWQSGEDAVIPLVSTNALPSNASERFKVIQKMALIPQFAFAGE
jgi:hypothetical protein